MSLWVWIEGHVTKNFFRNYLPEKFSENRSFGKPEILSINFVSNLNKHSNARGIEVIRWMNK